MESLANLESFVKAAEFGGFSAAARQLGLTPAAVSRNVAALEASLGVRLFERSTRRLALTEPGERFLQAVSGGLDSIRAAVDGLSAAGSPPAGVLKVSLAPAFGSDYILPLLPAFRALYPQVVPDWHFESRPPGAVFDLEAEGYDAAIGSGFELSPGMAALALAPVHVVAVAAPGYMAGRRLPRHPEDLATLDGIVLRSARTGRLRSWMLRHAGGGQAAAQQPPTMALNDPEAICRAALLGLGVALVGMPHALPHLEIGTLVRLLPGWHAEAGTIALYHSDRLPLPAKTRAFIDFVTGQCRRQDLARRLAGRPSSRAPAAGVVDPAG